MLRQKRLPRTPRPSPLRALGFLAARTGAIGAVPGHRPGSTRTTLRQAASEPGFLAAVLDSSLRQRIAAAGVCRQISSLNPEIIVRARKSSPARRRSEVNVELPRLRPARASAATASTDDAAGRLAPLPRLRLAAAHQPSRARPPRHRPYRLRRLLCLDREARRPVPARQAGDHRRRQARRRLDLLLHRPHLWRALGHADVQGAEGLPRRRRDQARHGEICRGRPPGPRADAGADAAGRAALDRRGLPRPLRHRTAAPCQPRP